MSGIPKEVVVAGGFDDLRASQIRFLEEAARLGNLTVLLATDEAIQAQSGGPPKFPLAERIYFLEAVRYVSRVLPVPQPCDAGELPVDINFRPDIWVDLESHASASRQSYCQRHGLEYGILPDAQMKSFLAPSSWTRHPTEVFDDAQLNPIGSPEQATLPASELNTGASPLAGRKKVVVTGCYDWLHTGHIRFFEEVSQQGDLYVVLGHDANIRELKGEGHPLFTEAERRYVVGSIKYVKEALISSGEGWLDADPEIRLIKPDIYAVNEDGDRGGKREYCARMGLEYLVLKRTPAPGSPRRSSTDLRGF